MIILYDSSEVRLVYATKLYAQRVEFLCVGWDVGEGWIELEVAEAVGLYCRWLWTFEFIVSYGMYLGVELWFENFWRELFGYVILNIYLMN